MTTAASGESVRSIRVFSSPTGQARFRRATDLPALAYRLSSFYLRPVWGFFALRRLQRNRYL